MPPPPPAKPLHYCYMVVPLPIWISIHLCSYAPHLVLYRMAEAIDRVTLSIYNSFNCY